MRRVTMSGVNEQVIDGVFEDVEPPCVALTAPAQDLAYTRKNGLHRPDPSFVTQLIATAEQVPQTRTLRRAAPADALSAYGTSRRTIRQAGLCMRQVI
jgi:hypothetical protein